MLEHAQWQYDRVVAGKLQPHEYSMADDQQMQIFQAFGEMKFATAEPLLRQFVPKRMDLAIGARAAAVWALGHIHEGVPNQELTDQFIDRLSDINSMMPEANEVRQMCAVGLGRMKATSALPVLQKFAEFEGADRVGQACWWSIEQMSDRKRPEFPPMPHFVLGWFLQPIQELK
jgi:hypothetical protein